MTKRWPDYWDLCLQCRYAGLDNVADFIHEMMDEARQMHEALSKISYAQYNADSKDIANAALEFRSASFKTKVKLKVVK